MADAANLDEDGMPPFGPHPHRGHSVVTVLLQGKMKSWDSFQGDGKQPSAKSSFSDMVEGPASYWVDAGSGLFHDEVSYIPDESDPAQRIRLLQVWVGVSEADRSKPPHVQIDQNISPVDIFGSPSASSEVSGAIEYNDEIVVGTAVHFVGGPNSKIATPHPIAITQIRQQAGTLYRHPIDSIKHGGFVVNLAGRATFGDDATPDNDYDVLVLKNQDHDGDSASSYLQVTTPKDDIAEYVVATGERIGESWAKKLVANGAIIAATLEEARALAPSVKAMSDEGLNGNGSFAPFGL